MCNNPICFSDRHKDTYSQYQLTLIEQSVYLHSVDSDKDRVPYQHPICLCFHPCHVAKFKVFQFFSSRSISLKDIWMLSVSVLGVIDFLKSLAPKKLGFNYFLHIELITSSICSLIHQIIHLKSISSQQHHLLKLWTMILFYLHELNYLQ